MNDLILIDNDLDVLSLSKKDIQAFSESIVRNFDESSKDPLQVLAFVSKMKTMLDAIEKGLTEKSMNDLHSYGGKKEAFGIDFQISEVGVKYDYSENIKWIELQNQINELETKRKEMESFIKGIKSSFTQVDEETGEAIKWHPASKSSSTTIKKTIK